ncbi:hypothetical protein EB75_28115 [Mycobacterium sp. ST-F2]|nr:hypothetical protein EB75_28115 [Mycobacterium sp. ST-F2]
MAVAVGLRFRVWVVVDQFGVDPRAGGVGLDCELIFRGRVVARVGDGFDVERFALSQRRALLPLGEIFKFSSNRKIPHFRRI